MSALSTQIAGGVELAMVFSGAWLLWRLWLSPSARAERKPPVLTAWDISLPDFFLFVWCVLACVFAGQVGSSMLLKRAALGPQRTAIFATAIFQLSILTGMAIFRLFVRRPVPKDPLVTLHPALSGTATFLISIPVLTVVSLGWRALLDLCGFPPEKQDALELFASLKSPGLIIIMAALATVTAPITEELFFRAGIFRYVRTRLPRWAALLLPACIFGAAHTSLTSFAPLVALGVIFALAYERTGRIGTTMVAHALFNLNTVVLILCGVDV